MLKLKMQIRSHEAAPGTDAVRMLTEPERTMVEVTAHGHRREELRVTVPLATANKMPVGSFVMLTMEEVPA